MDVTNTGEKPREESIGTVETNQGPIQLTWSIEHGIDRIRTWTIRLKFLKTGETKNYKSYSYLLKPDELTSFLKKAGFSSVERGIHVGGENNYDVFLARK